MFWSAIGASSADRSSHSDFWYGPAGVSSASGVRVTPDRALALPAVYAAVHVITDSLMQIPLIMYERTGEQTKERATEHHLYGLLHDKPNDHQTSPEWREVMQHHLLLRGNAYSLIEFGHKNRVESLGIPIHPDLVRTERVKASDGSEQYRYLIQDGGAEKKVKASQILHLRGPGMSADGISGLSPIAIEREAVGAGLAAQDFTSRFFQNDARPGGWIEHPSNFKSDEQRNNFLASFQSSQTGANRGKHAVFEYGMKYHSLDLKLVDAQFLETRKYTNLDIARIFRVPPHLIMELDRATFSNITQQDIEFVKFTMLPWLVRWEKRLSAWLLNEDERKKYSFEFLVDGLERGDGEARSRYYKAGIVDGWLTRNEVRRRENLNPLQGLDEPLEPMNMRNPGGDNDERLNALKQNAAEALARKQRFMAMESTDPESFIRNDWQRVRQFMKCATCDAQRYSDLSAAMYKEAALSMVDWDAWESQQVRLLMEMT